MNSERGILQSYLCKDFALFNVIHVRTMMHGSLKFNKCKGFKFVKVFNKLLLLSEV